MTLVEIQRWISQSGYPLSTWAWLGTLALVAVFVAALATRKRLDVPYVAANSLLTAAERKFFLVLERALANEYRFFAKVRLADLLQVERGIEGKRRYAAFGRISSKHADFVVCDPSTFAVLGVIELDDSSHRRRDRQDRDRFFDAAMAAAGIPVLRVTVQRTYSSEELREEAHAAFGRVENRGSQRN